MDGRGWRWVHSEGDRRAVRCGEEGSVGLEHIGAPKERCAMLRGSWIAATTKLMIEGVLLFGFCMLSNMYNV